MSDELIDTRPEIEPEFYMHEALPSDPEKGGEIAQDMTDRMRGNGAQFMRMTIVSPKYPCEPYPDGFYLEGWSIDPARHDPPGKQAPFNFPLTATT